MGKVSEKIRILLVADNEVGQKSGSPQRPKKCFLLTVAQVMFVFIFLSFLIFIANKVVRIERDMSQKGSDTQKGLSIPGSDFCKSVNTENMSLVALGYLTGVKKESIRLEAMDKVYYVTDRLMSDQEACSVEAALRLLQDKSIFVVEIGNITANSSDTKTDYVLFLRQQYTNLNRIKSTLPQFFKGSPFQTFTNVLNPFSIFAAKILLVWQFGGTVLSPNLLLLNRKLFDNSDGFCQVDRELLFCPNQCSAYVYQLVKSILDFDETHKNSSSMIQDYIVDLVDKSVADYCGDKESVDIGCVGVQRIQRNRICRQLNQNCDFLRVQEWKEEDRNWKSSVQKLCPKIVQQYMPGLIYTSRKPLPII